MSEPRLDPDERQVERSLGLLKPVGPSRATVTSVLIEAERRRRRAQLWTWRAVAAVLALALAVQFSLQRRGLHPGPTGQHNQIAVVGSADHTRNDASLSMRPVTGDDYISTRNRMIAFEKYPPRAPVAKSLPPPEPVNRAATTPEYRSPSLLELIFTNTESVHS